MNTTLATPGPVPLQPGAVKLHGSALAQWLLRLAGWRVVFEGLPSAQGVMVAYPHTSNWDFPVAMLAKWAIGFPLGWWAKASLFRWPLFGTWLRLLGGLPLERRGPQGVVGQAAEALRLAREEDRFLWLGLSPEGTRRRTEGWRSGFWRIAHEAEVPLGLSFLDFGRREVRFVHFWRLGGNAEADLAAIAEVVAAAGVRGCRPDQAAPVRLLPPGAEATRGSTRGPMP